MTKEQKKVLLEGALRADSGKKFAKGLRRDGIIPAIVYGDQKDSVSIQVPQRSLIKALQTKAGENVLINLRIEGASSEKETAVLIKALQHHPVSRQVIHADFYRVSLSKKITVNVPLNFKGEAIGVKQDGGVLEHLRWDLELQCLPTEIPEELVVEIEGLEMGKSISVKEISLPASVELMTDPEQPVISCVAPRVEEEPETAAEGEEGAEEGTEPEVLKQKSPEEIEAEAADAKAKDQQADKEKKAEKKEEKKES